MAVTDPLGFDSALQYTPVDQLDTLTDPLGGETRQTYDEARQLTAVINARGHAVESYGYDDHGRLTSVSNALGQTSHYQHDGQNRLSQHRDRMNRTTHYEYDLQGRINAFIHPDGDTLRITRDAVGRIQSIEDNTSRIDYSYDPVDRLIKERTTNAAGSHEVAYTWDNLDRLIRRTVNGTDPTDYRYDLAGRLIEIEYRGSLTTYLWDAADRLVAQTLPNGIHQSYSWDASSRLTHIEYRDAEDQLIEAIAYEYDAKGQRTRKTGGPGSAPETPFEAEYDAADRMTSITLYPGTPEETIYSLDYDAEGNLTRKQNLDDTTDTTDYTWDVRGRLTGITGPGVTATFQYDALNRRIERTIDGNTLRAIYDGPQLIGEIAGGIVDPTYLTGLQIDEMIARHTHQGARTYLTDALGSVIAQTDDDQTPINWYRYSPYGEVEIIGDDEGNPVQYTGRENDRTGLYYYRARYYDPVLKRFISKDPIGLEAGVNFYSYVLGNPVNLTDPMGLRARHLNAWQQYQRTLAGQGLTPTQRSQLYRQAQRKAWAGPQNRELHEAWNNLPDRSEELVNIPNQCSFRACVADVEVCLCYPERTPLSCPVPTPSLRPPRNQDPQCSCWIEKRQVPGL